MTLLLAESLVERGDLDAADVAARWVKWMKVDGRGVGLTTQRALRLIERGVEPFEAGRQARSAGASASNGAVMRCIPVALRARCSTATRISSRRCCTGCRARRPGC